MGNRMVIKIGSKIKDDETIVSELEIPRRLGPYFDSTEFVVTYDSDISDCPECLYPIPALTTILPIAWIENADVHVDLIDRRFCSTIEDVRAGYKRLFGEEVFGGSGRLHANHVKEVQASPDESEGLLFSGGVDSLATLVRYQENIQKLYTVHGADVPLTNVDAFETVASRNETIAEKFGCTLQRIQSNFRECLNYTNLDLYHRHKLQRFWWVGAHHGIALPGLCAPLAHTQSLQTVYLSASYSQDPEYPTIQPYITNNLSYAATKTEMTLTGLTRQQRIELILDWLKKTNTELYIRSCYHDEDGNNCNDCEKCYRSVLGLAAGGLDPNTCGYRYDRALLQSIRLDFESGEIELSHVVCSLWKQIQTALVVDTAPEPKGGDGGFFNWFKTVDFDQFATEKSISRSWKHKLLQQLPPHIGCQIARIYRKLPTA